MPNCISCGYSVRCDSLIAAERLTCTPAVVNMRHTWKGDGTTDISVGSVGLFFSLSSPGVEYRHQDTNVFHRGGSGMQQATVNITSTVDTFIDVSWARHDRIGLY